MLVDVARRVLGVEVPQRLQQELTLGLELLETLLVHRSETPRAAALGSAAPRATSPCGPLGADDASPS